jgi:hypothetical protein
MWKFPEVWWMSWRLSVGDARNFMDDLPSRDPRREAF